jgi:competence protein ComEC
MWLGVLACAAAQVAVPLAAPFTALTAPLLVYVQRVAHETGATPLSVIELRASPVAIVLGWIVVAGLTGWALRRWGRYAWAVPRRRTKRWWVAVPLVVAAFFALHQERARPAAPGELVISFLDIGQGDATLIQLDGTAVLVDTGPPDGPILTRLEEAGIERLDALMLTHAETDHEGAAAAVIRAYAPRMVIDGGAGWPSPVQRTLASLATRIHAPAAGEVITLGRLTFRVLWPPPRAAGWRAAGNPNDNALVTRLEANGLSVLLTADAESAVLAPLAPQPVDVLKVSHHGSADPGLPQLLARLRPRIAAIEVGGRNTYGHPAPSTLRALRVVPRVVRTDRDGTVRVRAARGRVWVEP